MRAITVSTTTLAFAFAWGTSFAAEPAQPGADAQLIPREILFGNPDIAGVEISPDGTRISYLAPKDGVLNVWVAPIDDLSAAKCVTDDRVRGIRSYFWAYNNRHILYLQDIGGDENFHVYAVDLETGKTKDLTPFDKVRARIEGVSHKFPQEVIIGLNDRNPQFHDLYRVNVTNGAQQLVQKNDAFAGFLTDDDYRVRFAMRFTPDGGNEVLSPDGRGGWQPFIKIPMEDTLTTNPLDFDKSSNVLYAIDSRGRDTGALRSIDLKTGKEKTIAEDPLADAGGILQHPTEKTIEAVSFTHGRREWRILDPDVQADFDYLRGVADGDMEVVSRSLDDNQWIVAYIMDNGPVRYYHYDRPKREATFLFTNRDELEGLPLVKMHDVVIPARDGLELVSYLSLPPGSDTDGDGRPDHPLPMVLNVHGGPWGRDNWGYNALHQWLANRGYAVLSVNFRGSTGFGKEFVNAGNREWGAKMHDDLLDAVDWAVEQGIAEKDNVAILGGSYGGYATLVGMTMTPDVFACGVDIVGPSNIVTLLSTIPPYWAPQVQMFKDRVGDHTTEEGRAFLASRSPLTYVDAIKKPLLIGQGANDPRVKQAESDQIVTAMKKKNIPVTYVLYPDEGHGFVRPENRMSFFAVAEAFLAENLDGRYEPIGDALKGSSITVPEGADDIPGLAKPLAKHRAEREAAAQQQQGLPDLKGKN